MKRMHGRLIKDCSRIKAPRDFEQGIENTLLLDSFYGILNTFMHNGEIDNEKKRLLYLIIRNESLQVISRKTPENRQYYEKLIECCKMILSIC